jgi:hypothetical protein
MSLRMPLLVFLFLLFGCNSPETPVEPKSRHIDSIPKSPSLQEAPDIYGVRINGDSIFLMQWDSTLQLSKLLGKPLTEKIRQLDQHSDTHSGSFIKELIYDGLKLKLFSPKQNGRTFWIQEIILTNNKFSSVSGTRMGDSLEKVKKDYPGLKLFPGNSPDMYYVADQGYEKSIEMEFVKKRLKSLRLYYMIP